MMSEDEYVFSAASRSYRLAGAEAAHKSQPRDSNPYANSPAKLRAAAWWYGYDHQLKQEKKKPMTQLYETPEGKFVQRLATNSENLAVVEEKGTGNVFKIDPSLLKRVVPFTIAITFNGSEQHFIAPKEIKLAVGDLVISKAGALGIVTLLGSESATRGKIEDMGFRRVVTEAL